LTPEQLRELREELPAYAQAAEPTPLQLAFCRYYGIDFTATHPGLHYCLGTVQSGDFRLAVHCWQQEGASSNLLLVHGYFDHSGLFGKLIEHGLSLNCNGLIFDLPGHGLSSGAPAVIDDFADYSAAIRAVLEAAQWPQLPLWVMAQSTGCAALVEYTRHYSWPFAATVLLAPLVRPLGWKSGRLAHSVLRHFVDNIERKLTPNSTDPEFLEFLKRDPLQSRRLSLRWVTALRAWLAALPSGDLGVGPALIVQGDADQTVDWRYNVAFYQGLFPASEVELLPGGGHQLANESPSLRQTYLERADGWLARQGLPIGSAEKLALGPTASS
jgi:alpha-beta hydrolase superfamily lysophospholipase